MHTQCFYIPTYLLCQALLGMPASHFPCTQSTSLHILSVRCRLPSAINCYHFPSRAYTDAVFHVLLAALPFMQFFSVLIIATFVFALLQSVKSTPRLQGFRDWRDSNKASSIAHIGTLSVPLLAMHQCFYSLNHHFQSSHLLTTNCLRQPIVCDFSAFHVHMRLRLTKVLFRSVFLFRLPLSETRERVDHAGILVLQLLMKLVSS